MRRPSAATTNCTKPKNLGNIFSPLALIKYHTGNPRNLCGILSRMRGFHKFGLAQGEFLGISASEWAWPPCSGWPHLPASGPCHSWGPPAACPGDPGDRLSGPRDVCVPPAIWFPLHGFGSSVALSSWWLWQSEKYKLRGLC